MSCVIVSSHLLPDFWWSSFHNSHEKVENLEALMDR
jgi:hypothetical protein